MLNQVTKKIIQCAYQVNNVLGYGFLEKVYENALAHEIRKQGLKVETQKSINVYYDGVIIGEYAPDLFVEDCVIVELKSVKELNAMHFSQCLNYLRATELNVCLLLNFHTRVEVRRIVKGSLVI